MRGLPPRGAPDVRDHGPVLTQFAPGNYRALTSAGHPFSDGIVRFGTLNGTHLRAF